MKDTVVVKESFNTEEEEVKDMSQKRCWCTVAGRRWKTEIDTFNSRKPHAELPRPSSPSRPLTPALASQQRAAAFVIMSGIVFVHSFPLLAVHFILHNLFIL